ncbi:Bug family tripartite tricarboxylate transporter substrate binding protein [Ancylobacter oerskovii]|uniref:Bug family tripartite tricarboxylate transporter substrate binding protein n=1 Tax=Ancylobacter oerskovii TaxID=459519 RepID=A0ABW4YYS0_9HYPH
MKGLGRLQTAIVSAVLMLGIGHASAGDAYPTRPITMIVPFAAGGNNDVSGRVLATKLGEILGQPVVVENRTGAGGAIGAGAVATAAPDGYTLGFLSSGPLAANVSISKLSYDPRKDFTAIARFTVSPSVLVVAPSFPAQTLEAFIAYGKQKPGELNYGTAGQGSSPHLAGALFESMSGVAMMPIAYKGGAPALTDVMSGQIETAFNPILEVMPQVNAGKLKALAVTTTTRSSLLPDVPAISEQLPGFEVLTWNGLVGPAGLSPAIVEKLNSAVREAIKDPSVLARLKELGLEVAISSPTEFQAYIDEQIEHFAKLARIAKVEIN